MPNPVIDVDVDIPANLSAISRAGRGLGAKAPRKGSKLSLSEVTQIKRYFGWAYDAKLPRCPGRAKVKVAAFEEKGDFSHSGKDHICPECRCSHIAGAGTKGDFYGLGDHTGHYGAGWCYFHEKQNPHKVCITYALRCIKDLRRGGMFGYKSNAPYLKQIEDDASEADTRVTVRAEINLLRAKLQEMLKKIEEGGMTESSKDGPVEASDVSVIKSVALLGKTISSIAIDDMHLSEMNYVNTEDVKIRAQQTVALTRRIVETHGTFDDWVKGYMEIWSSLKTVNQKR
jgi:hypothetical protein